MNRFFLVITFLFVAFNSFSQTYEELVAKSVEYAENNEYTAAEETLKQAMKKEPANPGNILLLSNLGTIQRQLGKKQEAFLSYSSALTKYPKNIFILQNRAALLCEMDSLNAAMKDYNTILAFDPDNVEALYRRGLLYMTQKNILSAEDDFEQAISKDPNYLPAHNSLLFIIKSREDWADAEEKYTDLIYKHRNTPSSELYIGRAECYLNLKKLARANEDLRKAAKLSPNDPLLYIVRGQVRIQQFDKPGAREDFQKAEELGADKEMIKEYLSLCK